MPTVTITRVELDRYVATNEDGATLEFGRSEGLLTPIQLLLVGLGGCTGMDVDHLTSRRCEPESFEIEVSAEKAKDDQGRNVLEEVEVTFRLRFPEGPEGDAAREALPASVERSHDRLCTVGQTLQQKTPVASVIE